MNDQPPNPPLPAEPEWASAATLAGLPGITMSERTLFRLARKKLVPTKVEGGVTLLLVAAVRARIAAKAAARAPVAKPAATGFPSAAAVGGSGGVGGGGSVSVGTPAIESSGELAALLFDAFEDGQTPSEIVREQRLPPAVVTAAWREYQTMQQAEEAQAKSKIAVRVDELARQIESVEASLASGMASDVLGDLQSIKERLAALEHCLENALLVPKGHVCPNPQCQAHGYPNLAVICGVCGTTSVWGIRPPQSQR